MTTTKFDSFNHVNEELFRAPVFLTIRHKYLSPKHLHLARIPIIDLCLFAIVKVLTLVEDCSTKK